MGVNLISSYSKKLILDWLPVAIIYFILEIYTFYILMYIKTHMVLEFCNINHLKSSVNVSNQRINQVYVLIFEYT